MYSLAAGANGSSSVRRRSPVCAGSERSGAGGRRLRRNVLEQFLDARLHIACIDVADDRENGVVGCVIDLEEVGDVLERRGADVLGRSKQIAFVADGIVGTAEERVRAHARMAGCPSAARFRRERSRARAPGVPDRASTTASGPLRGTAPDRAGSRAASARTASGRRAPARWPRRRSPATRATCSPLPTFSEPANIMCSNRCANPRRPCRSSREPTA